LLPATASLASARPAIAASMRRQCEQTPQPGFFSSWQRSARPTATASVRLPMPSGPLSSSAGGSRPWRTARRRISRIWSWPRTSSNTGRRPQFLLDGAERRGRHARLGLRPVDHDEALRLGRDQLVVAVADALVELALLPLHPVLGAAVADPR